MGFVTKLFLLASAVFMALFVSCDGRRSYPRSLLVADSLADCDPDSAIALLGILGDSARFMPRQDSMYYALLKVKATDKAYLPHDTTGGILDIVAYYEHGGDRRLLPTAYYYAGRAYRNMNKFLAAVDYFYKALDAARDHGDDRRIIQLSYSQIADLLYLHKMYKFALDGYSKALHYDSVAGYNRGILFEYRDMANCHVQLGDTDRAIVYFDKGLELAAKVRDEMMKALLSNQKARLCVTLGDYAEAEKLLDFVIATNDSAEFSSAYSIIARLYASTGRMNEAIRCYKVLAHDGNIYGRKKAYEELAEYYTSLNVEDSAEYYSRLYEFLSDSVERIKDASGIMDKKWEYDSRLLREEVGHNVGMNVLVCVCGGILLLLVVLFLYKRKQWLWRLVEPVGGKDNASHSEGEKHNEGAGVPEIMQSEEMHGDETSQDSSREDKETRIAALPVVRSIKAHLNDKTSDVKRNGWKMSDQDWIELDGRLNEICPGFKQTLLNVCSMSDKEYKVCMLVKIGVRPADIARLLFCTYQSVSNIRSRLFEKYFHRQGTSSEWDEYIRSL